MHNSHFTKLSHVQFKASNTQYLGRVFILSRD